MTASWVPALGGWLLTYLLHSTLLLGGAWLVTRRRVVAAARREVLWKVALVGGLVSATAQAEVMGGSLGWSLPLPPLANATVSSTSAAQAEPEAWTGLLGERAGVEAPQPGDGPAAEAPVDVAPEAMASPAVTADPAPTPAATAAAGWTAGDLVTTGALAWLVGGGLLVLLYAIQRARALHRIGPRRAVDEEALLLLLARLRERGGVRRAIRLTAAPGLGSPIALGADEIVLPEAALLELDPEQQEGLLAHELAHLVRRDPAWLTFACVLERLFFLQPLNLLARRELQEAAEYLCDDWAVTRTGSGFSLARCLVKVAEWVDTRPATVPLAGMAARPSQLVSRVHRLLEGRPMPASPRSFWFLAGAVALVGVTAVAAPGITTAAPAPQQEPGAAAVTGDVPLSEAESEAMLAEITAQADTDDTTARRSLSSLERQARGMAFRERRLARSLARSYGGPALAPAAPRAPMAPLPPMPAVAPRAMALADAHAHLDEVRALSRLRAPMAMAFGGERQRDTSGIAVPALMAALKDPDVQVRRAAAQALANHEDPRAVPALIDALKDSDAEVRATAAMALGEFEDKRAGAPLVALLKDGNVEVRRAALYALQGTEAEVPVDAIVAAMGDADDEIRQAALGLALSRLHRDGEEDSPADPRFVALFTRLLADRDADVRAQAVMALAEAGLKEAPAALLEASKDRSSDVRQAVAQALGEIGDAKGVPTLKTLLADSDADVREQAVSALGEIRDRSALEALVGALRSSDPVVRRAAAEMLGSRDGE